VADVTPRPLYSQEITTVSILNEAWEDCRTGLDKYEEEKMSCPHRCSNPGPSRK